MSLASYQTAPPCAAKTWYDEDVQVSITLIDKSLPLPRYESNGATAFDFLTRVTTVVPAHTIGLVPGNVVIQVPAGFVLLVLPRSSLARKKGLICPHGMGVIDQDYCGPEDEIFIQVQNTTDAPVTIERGERIAQGLFVKIENAVWNQVEDHGKETRGGFGSTDKRRPVISSSTNLSRKQPARRGRSTASSGG